MSEELQLTYEAYCIQRGSENVDIFEHLPILREYSSQCKHVTEFGMRAVVSTWGLLAGKPETLLSYDLNYHPNVENLKRIAKDNGILFKFIQIDILKTEIEETDLLFIDSLHTFDQLTMELKLHANKARKFLIMHDTVTYAHVGMDGFNKGLMDALQNFLNQNLHWKEIVHYKNNNGLLILGRSIDA